MLEPRKYYNISSSVELANKLAGLAETWALEVSGIELNSFELFFRPGPSSGVGYPLPLQIDVANFILLVG